MLYVLARSLAGGKREGVLSALGTFLGGMVHVFAAALGVPLRLGPIGNPHFRPLNMRARPTCVFGASE